MPSCRNCRGEFQVKRKQRGRQFFCSPKCRLESWKKENPQKMKEYSKKGWKTYQEKHPRLCRVCGEEIARKGRTTKFTCSELCAKILKWKSQKKYKDRIRKDYAEMKMAIGCGKCDYKKCAAALDFHHYKGKDFRITPTKWARRNKDPKIREEILKSVLLCKNCHAEEGERIREGRKQEPSIHFYEWKGSTGEQILEQFG